MISLGSLNAEVTGMCHAGLMDSLNQLCEAGMWFSGKVLT